MSIDTAQKRASVVSFGNDLLPQYVPNGAINSASERGQLIGSYAFDPIPPLVAYSNRWRKAIPSRGTPASMIDDHIRRVRVDIQERFDTMLGAGGWAAVNGIRISRYNFFHFSEFGGTEYLTGIGVPYFAVTNGVLTCSQTGGIPIYLPLWFAPGTSVDEVVLSCETVTASNSNIDWQIGYLDVSGTPAITSIASGNIPDDTAQGNTVLSSTPFVVDSSPSSAKYYFLKLVINNITFVSGAGARVAGVRIKTSSTPSNHL